MEPVSPRANLFMACKERYNLLMNRESLDRESLDCVSCSSTTPKTLTYRQISLIINLLKISPMKTNAKHRVTGSFLKRACL